MMHKAIDRNGQEIYPAKPTHPGVVLREELEERAIRPSAFAIQIGTYPNAITEVVKGNRPITAALALKIDAALNVPAGYWMRLQANYDLNIERLMLVAA